MKKILITTFALFFVMNFVLINTVKADVTPERLKGRILLQVESKGEAWYVNPRDGKRYYMANGNEAYNIMRDLGVGINNKDLEKLKNSKSLAKKQSGKIFLQVESKGEAYYVDFTGSLHYLKNGSEAYEVMRDLGLGISNNDLEKIDVSTSNSVVPTNYNPDPESDNDGDGILNKYDFNPDKKSVISNKIYKFKSSGLMFIGNEYDTKEYTIRVQIPRDRYLMYAEYKQHLLNSDYSNITDYVVADDPVVFSIAYQLAIIAKNENISFNQLAIDFVQQLYYNDDKYTSKDEYPKYPIETLMDGSGDCEDLSFLLASLLLTWTDKSKDVNNYSLLLYDNHVAVGYSLKLLDEMSDEELATYLKEMSNNNSYYYTKNKHRYFFIETTNDFFEIGEMPNDLISKKVKIFELSSLPGFIK